MAGRKAVLRVAIRTFEPFESGTRKAWELFEAAAKTGLVLAPGAFDLPGLHEALFESGGLHDSTWDIAFLSTNSTWAEHGGNARSTGNWKGFTRTRGGCGASSAGHRVAAALDELIVDAIRTNIAEMGMPERAEKKIAVV